MTNHEFENYLALLGKLLRLNRQQSDAIGTELRDHLESRVAELVDSGCDRATATRTALEEFGDAASLARQFHFVSESYRRRWMMRFATISIALSFLVTVLVMSMWPTNARFGAPSTSIAQEGPETAATSSPLTRAETSADRDLETLAKLSNRIDLVYQDTPLSEVMKDLRDQFDINILLDQSARDDALSDDEPITFTCKNIRAHKGIRLMLLNHNGTFVLDEGILRIISMDVASDSEYFARRIFDVRQLLKQIAVGEKDRIEASQVQPGQINIYASGFGLAGGGSGRGGGLFRIQDTETPNETPSLDEQLEKIEETDDANIVIQGPLKVVKRMAPSRTPQNLLLESIKMHVAPDGWSDTNGDATIEIIAGLLIVHAREETLDEVNDLINEMNNRMVK